MVDPQSSFDGPIALTPIELEDLAPRLRERVQPRVDRLGYLGGFFKYMAHQPDALIAFDVFTEECKRALPVELAEAIALTVSITMGNSYERVQHERLAVNLGLSVEWVSDVERLDPDHHPSSLERSVRCVQHFVMTTLKTGGKSSGRELHDVARLLGPATAAAVALMTARYLGHAVISNALSLEPPVASIFEESD